MCRSATPKYILNNCTKDGLTNANNAHHHPHHHHYLAQVQQFQTLSDSDETEDLIMFTVAVILFCVGAVIAVINAYCMGTRCMRVGSNRELAHFSPCTYY